MFNAISSLISNPRCLITRDAEGGRVIAHERCARDSVGFDLPPIRCFPCRARLEWETEDTADYTRARARAHAMRAPSHNGVRMPRW